MRHLSIILTSAILFLGCSTSDRPTSKKLDTYQNNKTTNTTIANNKPTVFTSTNSNAIEIELVTTIGINGIALDIALSDDGNFAYIASGEYGLEVLDISDPRYPKLIGTYDTDSYVNHVEVVGNSAYVSYAAQTLENYVSINTFDITNPHFPYYKGYYEGFTNNNHTIVETQSLLYYLFEQTLYITNKEDTKYQSSYELFNPYALAVYNGYIFVANDVDGVTILKTNFSNL